MKVYKRNKLDLLNADGLDDSFSNFDLLGIGKPSSKQIVRWEKTNPQKIYTLLGTGKLTQKDVDDANVKEKYTPTNVTGGGNSDTNMPVSKAGLPFTDAASFITYAKTLDKAGLTAVSGALKQVQDAVNTGLTSDEIAEQSVMYAGVPLNATDIDILKSVASDDVTMKSFNDIVAAPQTTTTPNTSTTKKSALLI